MKATAISVLGWVAAASCGTILWDGRFNDLSSSADLLNWSWSNQVGPYQYYIHGDSNVTAYVNLSPDYKNPSDSGSVQGAKITLDSTSYWEGQTMRRTELVPQASAAINSGLVWYHFSLMRSDTNAPSIYREHQIAFFESHFTELKAGWISGETSTSDSLLRWDISGTTYWNTTFDADVWHNVAYEIDFDAGSVGFWHSTGGDDLVQTVAPVSVSASSNGQDWHLGVLELPRDGYADADEDLYFSGVYVEDGEITTGVSGPGSSGGSGSSSSSSGTGATTTSSKASSTATTPTTTQTTMTTTTSSSGSSSTCTAAQYSQCGGIGWTGCTTCAWGYTCNQLNSYYYQCL